MIKVTVTRGAGDMPAASIVAPLLSGSIAAAKERGRIELDINGSQREKVPLEIDSIAGLEPNMLIEIAEQGQEAWAGIIDSISMEITASVDDSGRLSVARSMRIEIEREEVLAHEQ